VRRGGREGGLERGRIPTGSRGRGRRKRLVGLKVLHDMSIIYSYLYICIYIYIYAYVYIYIYTYIQA